MNEEIQKEIFREERKNKVRKTIKNIVKGIIIFGITSALFFTYTTYISTTKIEVREYRITNSKIPDSFKGLKISTLLDIVLKSFISILSRMLVLNQTVWK